MEELFRRKELLRHSGLFRQSGPARAGRRIPGLSGGLCAAALLLAAFLLLAAAGDPGKRRFFLEPTLELPVDTVHQYLVLQEDSIPNDTLFQLRSSEGFPLAYYRKINTNVCFDGKCRMLKVRLYWNITGRYLGIELPPGEFLSKSDHKHFNLSEYARMNQLLADSLSPLADYTFEELVPSTDKLLPSSVNPALGNPAIGDLAVDAVTSATAPAMADHVIKGAAYTTYRLWHFVYGPTQDKIVRLTEEALSQELLVHILASSDISDIAWALQRIQRYSGLRPELLGALLGFIENEDFSLATMAINSIQPADLASANLQRALLEKLPGLNYSLKKKIIDKLGEAPALDEGVKTALVRSLDAADGSYMTSILELFLEQEVSDAETCRMLSGLLEHENNFIARQVFEFLEKADCRDEDILQRMARYKQQQSN